MGIIHCSITSEELSPMTGWNILRNRKQGAVIWFYGNVREQNEGQDVEVVVYEGISSLGESTLRTIAEECHKKWSADLDIFISHRVGNLVVGETSIVIGVASPHRAPAYEASRYIIEEVKKRLPIWKKELYRNGKEAWLRGNSLNG